MSNEGTRHLGLSFKAEYSKVRYYLVNSEIVTVVVYEGKDVLYIVVGDIEAPCPLSVDVVK
jgi:hypothetical protein